MPCSSSVPVAVPFVLHHRDCRLGQQEVGLLGREDRQPLLLGGQEVSEVGCAAPGDPLRRSLRSDEVDLAGERLDPLAVERAAGQEGAREQCHEDRDRNRGCDPDEEAPAQRRQARQPVQRATAL